jgi:hypothetical protein
VVDCGTSQRQVGLSAFPPSGTRRKSLVDCQNCQFFPDDVGSAQVTALATKVVQDTVGIMIY